MHSKTHSRTHSKTRPIRATHPWLLAVLSFVALGSPGCSTTWDISPWRARHAVARPAPRRGAIEEDAARVESLRSSLDLASSRSLALSLATENPENSQALYLASRAESDEVFLLPEDDKESRALAALSSLDYSTRAVAAAEVSPEALAQHAWAMGTTTHLQPMFDRSEHAQKTLDAIETALARDPDNVVALATKSTLRLRLATLPWIARVMASGAPEGSIEEAISLARTCVGRLPSIENNLLLAKALLALDEDEGEVIPVLRAALAREDTYPRDHELRPKAEELLQSLEEE